MPIQLGNGDILEARFLCAAGNQIGLNIRHYKVANEAGTGITLEVAAQHLDGAMAVDYKALLSEHATYRGVGLRRIGITATAELHSIAGQGPGLIAGDLCPKQTCGVITLQSGLPGRGKRGRAFIPFPSETSNDEDSTPTAAYINLLGNLGSVLSGLVVAGSGGNIADLKPVIWNRTGLVATDIIQYRANDRWGTQRRRSDYGAMNWPPF